MMDLIFRKITQPRRREFTAVNSGMADRVLKIPGSLQKPHLNKPDLKNPGPTRPLQLRALNAEKSATPTFEKRVRALFEREHLITVSMRRFVRD
jgi:hypothetical protein